MTEAREAESWIFKVPRWFVAIALIFFGCWAYFGSTLIGGGVHIDPVPGLGMLFAATALLGMFGGYCVVRSETKARILANFIEVTLALGALSLIRGVFEWWYEMTARVPKSEAGHSAPGEVLFGVRYGLLSVGALIVFKKWIRKANPTVMSAPASPNRS